MGRTGHQLVVLHDRRANGTPAARRGALRRTPRSRSRTPSPPTSRCTRSPGRCRCPRSPPARSASSAAASGNRTPSTVARRRTARHGLAASRSSRRTLRRSPPPRHAARGRRSRRQRDPEQSRRHRGQRLAVGPGELDDRWLLSPDVDRRADEHRVERGGVVIGRVGRGVDDRGLVPPWSACSRGVRRPSPSVPRSCRTGRGWMPYARYGRSLEKR